MVDSTAQLNIQALSESVRVAIANGQTEAKVIVDRAEEFKKFLSS